MGDNGAGPALQPVDLRGGRKHSEERSHMGSDLSEVASTVEFARQQPSLPTEGNPRKQRGTAAVEDKGALNTSLSTGGTSGDASELDTDVGDCMESVVSSVDLSAAYEQASEALKYHKQQRRGVFEWINKCHVTIRSFTKNLRKYATHVFGSVSVGYVDVQSIAREGGNNSLEENYEQRFQAIKEYVIAADEYFTAPKYAGKRDFEGETEENDGTEVSSERPTASSSKDFIGSKVVDQGDVDTMGEKIAKSSEEYRKTEMPEEDFKAKRTRLTTTSSREGTITLTKRDASAAEECCTGDIGNPMTTQQDVVIQDVRNSRGEDERESMKMEGSPQNLDENNSTGSTEDSDGNEGEESHLESTAGSGSSEQEEETLMKCNKQHVGEQACNRAHLILKLVTRQGKALSRMTATSESHLFGIFAKCHLMLACVKCAGYVCNSAVDAHRMAQLARRTAISSGTPVIMNIVREAAVTATCTSMAVSSCEQVIQLHQDALKVLGRAAALLSFVEVHKLLGQQIVSEVSSATEDIQVYVDQTDFDLDELANKLSSMESKIDTLSNAFQNEKIINLTTRHMARKFTVMFPLVSATYKVVHFVLKAMAATTNALTSLSFRPGTQTEEQSRHENAP